MTDSPYYFIEDLNAPDDVTILVIDKAWTTKYPLCLADEAITGPQGDCPTPNDCICPQVICYQAPGKDNFMVIDNPLDLNFAVIEDADEIASMTAAVDQAEKGLLCNTAAWRVDPGTTCDWWKYKVVPLSGQVPTTNTDAVIKSRAVTELRQSVAEFKAIFETNSAWDTLLTNNRAVELDMIITVLSRVLGYDAKHYAGAVWFTALGETGTGLYQGKVEAFEKFLASLGK